MTEPLPSNPFSRPGNDPHRGRAMAEYGMSRAAEATGTWFPIAQQTLLRICQLHGGTRATGEEIGNAVTNYFCAAPRPQAWGALISWAIRQGLIEPTGRRVAMQSPRSHARKTDVYYIQKKP